MSDDLDNIFMSSGSLACNHGRTELQWCEHIRRVVSEGRDAFLVSARESYQVPIFPTQDIFAIVVIGDPIATGQALMWMEYTPDIGRSYKVPMGFWNIGEGMSSMRGVILDYMRSNLSPAESMSSNDPIVTSCPSRVSHTPKNARIVSEESKNVAWKVVCLWNIVFEKVCTVCLEESTGTDPTGLGTL